MANSFGPNIGLSTPATNDPGWDGPIRTDNGLLEAQSALGGFGVKPTNPGTITQLPSTSLDLAIASGQYKNSVGAIVTVSAVPTQLLTNAATNYVYCTDAGVITVSTSSFPAAGTPYIPIAIVTCSGGVITAIVDSRIQLETLNFAPQTGLAAAGMNQGTAAAITSYTQVEVTSSSGSNGVILPSPIAGAVIFIANKSTNAMNIYPPSGGTINGGSANAVYTTAAGAHAILFCAIAASGGTWYAK